MARHINLNIQMENLSKPRPSLTLRVTIAILFVLLASQSFAQQSLQPLRYNNPGLVVDLGVGLWAWPIPCDADGDGDFDLIVSCPDVPSNGVWFFENPTQDASNAFPIFKGARRLSRTVHYIMPSYVDGKLRVLSPGVEYLNFETKGIDSPKKLSIDPNFYMPQWNEPKGPKVRHKQWRYVDFDGDEKLDVVVGIEDWSHYGWDDAWDATGTWTHGPLHGLVYLFRNIGTTEEPSYEKPTALMAGDGRLDVFGCPSPNFEDWDKDGDLDLLCGEFLDGFTYFENTGSRTLPKYSAGRRLENSKGKPLTMNLQMIVPIAFDWDRDGDMDLIVGDEDGRVAFIESLGLGPDRTPTFAEPRYFQQQADTLKCGALATPFGYDWDSDGDIDIVSGNTSGSIEIFENLGRNDSNEVKWNAPQALLVDGKKFRIQAGPNKSIQGPAEAKWGYTTLNVADWDRDGLQDVVFNSIWGKVQWLKNEGSKSKPRFDRIRDLEVAWPAEPMKPAWVWWKPEPHQLVTQWRTTPVVYDFNNDGMMDLAMLDSEGYLALFRRKSPEQLSPPERVFLGEDGKPLRLNAKQAGGSGRRKLCITDWNGDGKFDWLFNSANADLLLQVDGPEGYYTFKSFGKLVEQNIEGHDVSPAVVDFDRDGVPDFLGGAEDGRMYYFKHPK